MYPVAIAGRSVRTQNAFEVLNPASADVVGSAADCGPTELNAAFAAASNAFASWRSDEDARRAALSTASAVIEQHADELARLLTAEQGKPLRSAREEVGAIPYWLKFYAGLDTSAQQLHSDADKSVEVRRRPLGVVAAIAPWNVPLLLAIWKIAPALLAGNSVVLKPSPYTPLSTLVMGELLLDVFPAGVLNIVSGSGHQLGEAMINHPTPRKVTFTGSVATGKRVATAAASDLKRVTLELGGNDPAIVLADADIERITADLFWGAFANNGQICGAIKRVYTHRSIYDELADSLAAYAKSVKVGDGAVEGVDLGPLNNAPQRDYVAGLVSEAVATGASTPAGGHVVPGPGYFYEPTIVTNLPAGTRLEHEEQFGPVLPILSYDSLDDAVRRANDSKLGLAASVWGQDTDTVAEVAGQLECGTVWTNTHQAFAPDQPWTGHKHSGIGSENGVWGYEAFTDLQVIHRKLR
jgi:acyl-CoA reductase-like NAD-dependent aldehyde dehydrogenase